MRDPAQALVRDAGGSGAREQPDVGLGFCELKQGLRLQCVNMCETRRRRRAGRAEAEREPPPSAPGLRGACRAKAKLLGGLIGAAWGLRFGDKDWSL